MKALSTLIVLTILAACQRPKLPSREYSQYEYHTSYSLEENELRIELGNPLHCPLRVWILPADKELQSHFGKINPILLPPTSDTLLVIPSIARLEDTIQFASRLGSTSKEIKAVLPGLPFPEGRAYRVIQGNNTDKTHNTSWSRYAVDLNLQVNDTVCAATDGYVVGVIDQYKWGGEQEKWKPYGNYITLYEPNSGVFTQYVHLVQDGSFVTTGDRVTRGQPIGLSGMTGQTDVAHLHFNCLVPENSEDGLRSIPFEFAEGYKSEELKKNDVLKK